MARMSPRIATAVALSLGAAIFVSVFAEMPSYEPKDGFVPDEQTAIAIAEAILVPIYGREQIASEKPFHAKLGVNGVWTVEGSLAGDMDGGVAIVRIQRKDGRIVYVMHGK